MKFQDLGIFLLAPISMSKQKNFNASVQTPCWQNEKYSRANAPFSIIFKLVWVFSDVLVAFLYFDICHYRQSKLAIENPEFSQPVVAGHFQWKIW